MNTYSYSESERLGLGKGLRTGGLMGASSLSGKANQGFDGGFHNSWGTYAYSTNANAMTIREILERRKRDSLLSFINAHIAGNALNGFGISPWGRTNRIVRAERGRRAGSFDADGRRVAVGEDGRRVVVDKDGRVATDAEGRRITLDAEGTHRLVDSGDGTRVIVDANDRIMTDANGRPLTVEPGADLRITTDSNGARVAADQNGAQRIIMADAAIDTARPTAATSGINAAADAATDFRHVDGGNTARFQSFLAQSGESLSDFQTRVQNTLSSHGSARHSAANAYVPDRLNTGSVRAGRFIRLATPNGLDLAVMGTVAGTVGVMAGTPNVSADGFGWDFNKKAAAETLPVSGTVIARNDGRTAESVVRGIEDVVEFASPFVFAAIGAKVGAGGGAAAGGIGAVPGALLGGAGGFAVGVLFTMGASEITRTIARGIGFDDVDRGLIGSFLTPRHTEQMENWVREHSVDGAGFGSGESLSDVIARVTDGAENDQERVVLFREFIDTIHAGIVESQRENLSVVAERISSDTGIDVDSLEDTLRMPEARDQIIAFYEQEAAQNPQDQDLQTVIETLRHFDAGENERVRLISARVGADIMEAREFNEEIAYAMDGANDGSLSRYVSRNAARRRSDDFRAIQRDLGEIDYEARLNEIRQIRRDADGRAVGDVVHSVFANESDAFVELGTADMIAKSYALVYDVEEVMLDKQREFIAENWEDLSVHFHNDAEIKPRLYQVFSRGTTLGASIARDLSRTDPHDSDAQELRRLLEETNGLQNVTQEQALQLVNNKIFFKSFQKAVDNDGIIGDRMKDNGFYRRVDIVQDVRHQMRVLSGTAAAQSFRVEVENRQAASPVYAPKEPEQARLAYH